MSKNKKESFFWTSYSDLMTSLFFVMLVLFVLTIVLLHKKMVEIESEKQDVQVKLEELTAITQINEQFQPLVTSGNFIYLPESKKFVAKDLVGQEIFEPLKTEILPEYVSKTIAIGREIEKLLIDLNNANKHFSYQLVIEGNMANKFDQSISKDQISGYKTSYERALAVYLLWRGNGIDLRKYNTEVLICGSGYNGIDRDKIEENNKRFSIQIVPKIEPLKK